MADRDRAAIDVVPGGIDAELVAAVQALAGEGLVELPDLDVVDLQALALQKLPGAKLLPAAYDRSALMDGIE